MTRLSRFERRILTAMAVVAVMPLLGSLVLGRGVLREAYQVGVNERVRDQLTRGLDVYRQHFLELKRNAELTTDAIAGEIETTLATHPGDPGILERLLRESLDGHPRAARLSVRDAEGRELARLERKERLDTTAMRLLDLTRTLPGENAPLSLTVTVAAPAAPFRDYIRAGELTEVYSRLQAGAGYVSNVFLVVYSGLLLSVIAAGLLVGIVISRRVTRRVGVLSDATRKVGAGDLTVQVPADTKDEIGELTHAFNAMVRDIRESKDRIEYLQRIGAWQQFARRLAHEIKNPLTPIQLAVQEVHRSYRGDDERYRGRLEEALSIVEEEVATLRRMVGEFSDFARLPEAQLHPADLNEVVRDASRTIGVLDDADRPGGTRGPAVEVEYDLAGQPLPVRVDDMMLKRCIDNLVRNAQQAIAGSRAGEKEENRTATRDSGRIVVRTRLDRGQAVLEVSDSGPGIAESERKAVFDPYFTTKAEGTGLGLAIVKKVVLEHQGEITCDGSDLGGASFVIRIPAEGGQE